MEIIIAWRRLENIFLSCNKYRKSLWDEAKANLEACWVTLAFVAWAKNLTLSLGLEAKGIGEDAIWGLMGLEIVIARLGVIAEPEWVNTVSQTSFSWYLHNQWTDFHKLSCTGKPWIRAICTYVGCTKATTNNWDIRPSVTVKVLLTNIQWMAR